MPKVKQVINQLEMFEVSIKEASDQLEELRRALGLIYHIQSRASYINNCFILPTEQEEPDAEAHRPTDEWFSAQLSNLADEATNLVSFLQEVFPDFDPGSLYAVGTFSWDTIGTTEPNPRPDYVEKGLDPYI